MDNAIIMAAGTSSRFAPLAHERPKALITVRGEVLIERQIRQLQQAGVGQVVVVVGYKARQFDYLGPKCGVILVENPEYDTRNNTGSLFAARDYLKNSYVCSADNYFCQNPFEKTVDESYYAGMYADGPTAEWCLETAPNGRITSVRVGGENAWYMMGHTFWSEDFSQRFMEILAREYNRPETAAALWETLFARHLETLPMWLRKYPPGVIYEFDTLDELRRFDPAFCECSGSATLARIAALLGRAEGELSGFEPVAGAGGRVSGVALQAGGVRYVYDYESGSLQEAGR